MYAQALTAEVPAPSARISQIGERRDAITQLRGTDAVSLRRLLRGDLDWIILRAMERDRDRRYETPNGFALDLERHLTNEPVLARSPSTRYRMGKFVRRHRAGVAFAAVLVLLLAGFGVAQAVQAERIRHARDLAETRREQAEGLIDFMLGDLREKLTPLGRLDVLGDVGAQAAAYFAALPEDELSEDELQSRSRALYQIGEVQLNQGSSAEATVAFRESLRLAEALSRRAPHDPDRLFGVGQSHFWVGFAAWRNSDLDAAEPQFQSYLSVAEQLVAQQPDNDEYRMELGYAHSNLGSLREARGDFAGAADAFRLTLDVKRALVARNQANIDWLGELAETHNTLAAVYRRSGDYAGALAEHERELEIKREILSRQPTHAYWRFRHAVALAHASVILLSMGDAAEAASRRAIATATLDSLITQDPTNVTWLRESAISGRRLGYALALTGRHAEARRQLALSETRLLEVIRRDSVGSNWRDALTAHHTERARALLVLDEPDAAEREVRRAREHAAAHSAPTRAQQRSALEADLTYGFVQDALGRTDSARVVFDSAIPRAQEMVDGVGGEFVPLLAEALVGARRDAEALPVVQRLIERGYRDLFLMSRARRHGLRVE